MHGVCNRRATLWLGIGLCRVGGFGFINSAQPPKTNRWVLGVLGDRSMWNMNTALQYVVLENNNTHQRQQRNALVSYVPSAILKLSLS